MSYMINGCNVGYGFPIKVVSERMLNEGLEFTDNRFVIEGNTSTPTTTGIW